MSDYIDTRDGWSPRDIDADDPSRQHRVVEYDENNRVVAMWVRETPVPALPTEPYTVIRVMWNRDHTTVRDAVLWLDGNATWRGTAMSAPHEDLPGWITSFEVLSEPRAVTAEAVLDRVRELQLTTAIGHVDIVDVVRTEFGAES